MVSVVEAGLGHVFAEAAFFDKVFFEAANLLVEKVVGLVNEANGDVGDDFGRAGFDVGFVGLVGFVFLAAEFADVEGFFVFFFPDTVASCAEVVAVVFEEFFEAGSGYVGELDFGFGGGDGGFAAFEDVLFAGTGSLDHLVDGSVGFGEVLLCEVVGEVVDDFRFAVREKFPVVAVRVKEFSVGHGEVGWLGVLGK